MRVDLESLRGLRDEALRTEQYSRALTYGRLVDHMKGEEDPAKMASCRRAYNALMLAVSHLDQNETGLAMKAIDRCVVDLESVLGIQPMVLSKETWI